VTHSGSQARHDYAPLRGTRHWHRHPEAKQALIFKAFTQGDGSLTRGYGGSGWGLTIAAQLVERMGGQIWVESEEGRGSVFHVTLCLGLQVTSAEVGSLASSAAVDAPNTAAAAT
jgi:hypothetical protein